MKKSFLLASLGALLLLAATTVQAGFRCAIASGVPYCQYSGDVLKVYTNDRNQIIMYVSSFNLSLPSEQGFSGVIFNYAFIYSTKENPEYAKMLYATLLAAQAQNRQVTVQLHRVLAGYLVVDRIWLN